MGTAVFSSVHGYPVRRFLAPVVRFSLPACSRTMLALFLWAGLSAAVASKTDRFQTTARATILMDARTGATLYQDNADEPLPPASLNMLMTLAVVFRALQERRITLEQEFRVSENAWRTGGAPSRTSAMFLPINSSETVETLIRGTVVQSGNDASIVLAEGLAGSEHEFALMMAVEPAGVAWRGTDALIIMLGNAVGL